MYRVSAHKIFIMPANTIEYNGNTWDLDYFIAATVMMEKNLGENPSDERIMRVEKRYKAIEERQSPKEPEKPKKPKSSKAASSKNKSVPDQEG